MEQEITLTISEKSIFTQKEKSFTSQFSTHILATTLSFNIKKQTAMQLPIANVSIKHWDVHDKYYMYMLEDEFIYTINDKIYYKYYLGNLFVDSNGEVYQVIDRKLPGFVRRLFSFIPLVCTVELVFKKTSTKMTVEQVRQHILRQLNQLEHNEFKMEWIEKVRTAKTFEEIMFI